MQELSEETQGRIRPLRRAEFDRMVDAGLLGEDERVELLFGYLVAMSPIGARHAATVNRLTRLLVTAIGDRGVVCIQNPLALSDDSEPQPDVAVVPPGDYDEALPTEALLVIEVADSSLETDRTDKARLYATAGVPEYWVVNLIDRVVEVSTVPHGALYSHTATYRAQDAIRLVRFPDLEISVSDVLAQH